MGSVLCGNQLKTFPYFQLVYCYNLWVPIEIMSQMKYMYVCMYSCYINAWTWHIKRKVPLHFGPKEDPATLYTKISILPIPKLSLITGMFESIWAEQIVRHCSTPSLKSYTWWSRHRDNYYWRRCEPSVSMVGSCKISIRSGRIHLASIELIMILFLVIPTCACPRSRAHDSEIKSFSPGVLNILFGLFYLKCFTSLRLV